MSNHVRADFCLSQTRDKEQLIQWFLALEALGCHMLTPDAASDVAGFEQAVQQLLTPLYANIEFQWYINGQTYEARIMQIWHPPKPIDISFDVAEEAFFGGYGRSLIEYIPKNPDDHNLFQRYKQLIMAAIQYLNPNIGLIDYEMDIVCGDTENRKFEASWGNYLAASALEQWDPNDLDLLKQTVDEAIWIDERGLLSFIHPLVANQAWTSRHFKVQELWERNPIL